MVMAENILGMSSCCKGSMYIFMQWYFKQELIVPEKKHWAFPCWKVELFILQSLWTARGS